MLPSLQPSRPKYPPNPQPPPLPHQQTRQTSHPSTAPSTSSHAAQPSPHPPRSQLEAMPPASAPFVPFAPPPGQPLLQPRLSGMPLSQHYDSSVRHPVFFTAGGLRKPPFPLPGATSGGVNPVAFGYVVEQRSGVAGGVKGKL